MKKFLALALVAAMMVSMLAACGSSTEEAAGGDEGSSTEVTKLVVGFDAEYPPYGYMDDDGNYTGFDLEMAEAVCDYYGWEFEARPIDWDSKDMELDSGSIDCIWNGFTMTGREDQYTWSIPYVDNSLVLMTAVDSGINGVGDLAGKKVGVQQASSADTFLQEDEGAELKETFADTLYFNSYNTAFVELQSGSIDAVIIDIGVAKYQIESRGDGKYKICDDPVSTEQYAIGFKKGNEELRDLVQDGLLKLVVDGTFEQLAEKYELSDYVLLKKGDVDNGQDPEDDTVYDENQPIGDQ